MKKICFITTISLTLRVFVLKTAEYLHNHTDWDISVICSDDADFAAALPEYIHYYPVKMERGISISGINAMLQMKRIFQREKFDLIQYSTPNASLYASLAGWMERVPVRLYCQWGMAYKGFHGTKKIVFKEVERIICHLSTHIEPDSKSNLEFAIAEGLYDAYKGHVVWNGSACGIDLAKFDPERCNEARKEIRDRYKIPEDRFVFIFVGRVTRDKGVNELFEAFKSIATKHYLHLLMVGPNEVNETADKNLYDWTLHDSSVSYVGYTDEVEKYLAAADCYVLPSYHEGFGMSILEAEAMGLPVIVTDIPGPRDAMIDGKTGIRIEKQNVKKLAEAMVFLYENPDIAKEYGKAGRIFAASNFDQKQMLEYILSDRKKIINGGDK